jgi:uncharacterized membrane protein YphA (DoxX/SURF4 family)
MSVLSAASQVILALGIANVWLFRSTRPTPFRPNGAANMKEEFAQYGLPSWSVFVVGGTKLMLAVLLLVGLVQPAVAAPAAAAMGALMAVAVGMHIRVRDPLSKAAPAALMLVLSVVVVATRAL